MEQQLELVVSISRARARKELTSGKLEEARALNRGQNVIVDHVQISGPLGAISLQFGPFGEESLKLEPRAAASTDNYINLNRAQSLAYSVLDSTSCIDQYMEDALDAQESGATRRIFQPDLTATVVRDSAILLTNGYANYTLDELGLPNPVTFDGVWNLRGQTVHREGGVSRIIPCCNEVQSDQTCSYRFNFQESTEMHHETMYQQFRLEDGSGLQNWKFPSMRDGRQEMHYIGATGFHTPFQQQSPAFLAVLLHFGLPLQWTLVHDHNSGLLREALSGLGDLSAPESMMSQLESDLHVSKLCDLGVGNTQITQIPGQVIILPPGTSFCWQSSGESVIETINFPGCEDFQESFVCDSRSRGEGFQATGSTPLLDQLLPGIGDSIGAAGSSQAGTNSSDLSPDLSNHVDRLAYGNNDNLCDALEKTSRAMASITDTASDPDIFSQPEEGNEASEASHQDQDEDTPESQGTTTSGSPSGRSIPEPKQQKLGVYYRHTKKYQEFIEKREHLATLTHHWVEHQKVTGYPWDLYLLANAVAGVGVLDTLKDLRKRLSGPPPREWLEVIIACKGIAMSADVGDRLLAFEVARAYGSRHAQQVYDNKTRNSSQECERRKDDIADGDDERQMDAISGERSEHQTEIADNQIAAGKRGPKAVAKVIDELRNEYPELEVDEERKKGSKYLSFWKGCGIHPFFLPWTRHIWATPITSLNYSKLNDSSLSAIYRIWRDLAAEFPFKDENQILSFLDVSKVIRLDRASMNDIIEAVRKSRGGDGNAPDWTSFKALFDEL